MSQTPGQGEQYEHKGSYAEAARKLNRLIRAGKSHSGHERNCCFLNVNGERFANVSMVSGFDYPDDGRAVAVMDWDGDGRQDLWLANRTAPRLRLLRNEAPAGRHLSLRLVGTRSNRDAIGARVTIVCDDHGKRSRLQRTVRAGEGFLAGHSKRIHFGLGDTGTVVEVSVRWPTGEWENFSGLSISDNSYELVEGTGIAKSLSVAATPIPRDRTTAAEIPPQTMQTQNLLTLPLPLPQLEYITSDGQTRPILEGKSFSLVTLCSRSCLVCVKELSDWCQAHSELQEAGIAVRPVSIDGLNNSSLASPRDPESLRAANDWSLNMDNVIHVGLATTELVDILQHAHNAVYDHHRPLPIPTSLLVDHKGQLRAIYKGSVTVPQIVEDVESLKADDPWSVGLPFPGKWVGRIDLTHNLLSLVEQMWRDGYHERVIEFVTGLTDPRYAGRRIDAHLFLADQLTSANPEAALRQAQQVLQIDAHHPLAHERMALIYVGMQRLAESLPHFQAAIASARPPRADAYLNYGRALRMTGDHSAAIGQLKQAVALNPNLPEAHEQLGLAFASQREFIEALQHFRQASALDPAQDNYRVNIAMALSKLGKDAEVWEVLRDVASKAEAPPLALLLSARSLERLERYSDAIGCLQRFLVQQPDAHDVRRELNRLQSLPSRTK